MIGEAGNDDMFGAAGNDRIFGGDGINDAGDGGAGTNVCDAATETQVNC